jgi:hypothetical protein
MQKQWKATTEHLCVNNKIGTGSGKEAKMVPVPVILFAVKTNEGGVGYYYSPACKNYKINKTTNHYRCETAIGEGDSPCQLVGLLNEALRREGILHDPGDGSVPG